MEPGDIYKKEEDNGEEFWEFLKESIPEEKRDKADEWMNSLEKRLE